MIKIVKAIGIFVGGWISLGLLIFTVTAIGTLINPPSEEVSILHEAKTAVDDNTTTEEKEPKYVDTVKEDLKPKEEKEQLAKEESTKKETSIFSVNKEEPKSTTPTELPAKEQKEQVEKIVKTCTKTFHKPKDKYVDQLKEYDQDIVKSVINKRLKDKSYPVVKSSIIEKTITLYESLFGETNRSKKAKKLLEQYQETWNDEMSEKKIENTKLHIKNVNDLLDSSQYIDLYLYKKENVGFFSTVDFSTDSIYFCIYGDQYVLLASDVNYPNEDNYSILCWKIPNKQVTVEDSNGFTRDVDVYQDMSGEEESLKPYFEKLEKSEKAKSIRNKFEKFFEKGL